MITSLLLAVRVCELVLVVQEQNEQVPVFPRHPWVAQVANVSYTDKEIQLHGAYARSTLCWPLLPGTRKAKVELLFDIQLQ